MDLNQFKGSAMTTGGVAAGAIAAGIARKKISKLDTTVGKAGLIVAGLAISAYADSSILKGLGTGVAVNGIMGLASNYVAGVDGLDGDGVGTVVQDENGMVYMMNGIGELEPYEIPTVETGEEVTGVYGDDEEAFSGVDGDDVAFA